MLSENLLIVGDVHVTLETLSLAEKVFELAYNYCVEKKVKCLFTGDLFHTKAIIRSECLNLALKYLRRPEWEVVLLVGNHDYENSNCDKHSLECFKDLPNVTVVDQPMQMNNCYLIPYRHDEEFKKIVKEMPAGIEYIFCHHGISGFLMNNTRKSDDGVKAKELGTFKKVICGHWHVPQEKGNIVYVGSPYQQNFGEKDQIKRFLTLDFKTGKLEDIVLNEFFPHYKTIEKTTDQINDERDMIPYTLKETDHIRFDVTGPKTECMKINKALLKSKYNLNCDVRLNFVHDNASSEEITIKDTLDYTKMFTRWLGIQKTSLDKDRILKTGLEYFNANTNV